MFSSSRTTPNRAAARAMRFPPGTREERGLPGRRFFSSPFSFSVSSRSLARRSSNDMPAVIENPSISSADSWITSSVFAFTLNFVSCICGLRLSSKSISSRFLKFPVVGSIHPMFGMVSMPFLLSYDGLSTNLFPGSHFAAVSHL